MIRHAMLLLLAFGLAAPVPVFADPATSHVLSQSTATIASGDTLDSVLGRASISPNVRAEAALALAGVYDLTELRPGHRLEWAAEKIDPTRH